MTTTSSIGSTTGTTSSAATATSAAQELNDRFLKLLVAQMQNQDPLNPLDNAEVTSQMAQINTVTGINTLNSTVTQLLDQFGTLEAQQAAQLIGHQVLVEGSSVAVDADGKAGTLGVELGSAADSVKVEIYDANGLVVRTLSLGELDAGITRFAWDGKNDAGVQVAAGNYTIKVTATADSQSLAATRLVGRSVESVQRSNGTTLLTMSDGSQSAYGSVREIL